MIKTFFLIREQNSQGGTWDRIKFCRDSALKQFFEIAEEESYDVETIYSRNLVTYVGTKRDSRITLTLTSV